MARLEILAEPMRINANPNGQGTVNGVLTVFLALVFGATAGLASTLKIRGQGQGVAQMHDVTRRGTPR